jgi:hypothetical protein
MGVQASSTDGIAEVYFGPYLIATLNLRGRGGNRVRLVPLGRCAPSPHDPHTVSSMRYPCLRTGVTHVPGRNGSGILVQWGSFEADQVAIVMDAGHIVGVVSQIAVIDVIAAALVKSHTESPERKLGESGARPDEAGVWHRASIHGATFMKSAGDEAAASRCLTHCHHRPHLRCRAGVAADPAEWCRSP